MPMYERRSGEYISGLIAERIMDWRCNDRVEQEWAPYKNVWIAGKNFYIYRPDFCGSMDFLMQAIKRFCGRNIYLQFDYMDNEWSVRAVGIKSKVPVSDWVYNKNAARAACIVMLRCQHRIGKEL